MEKYAEARMSIACKWITNGRGAAGCAIPGEIRLGDNGCLRGAGDKGAATSGLRGNQACHQELVHEGEFLNGSEAEDSGLDHRCMAEAVI